MTFVTIMLLIACILSSGFVGNIYKTLSGNCKSVSSSAALPSVWLILLGAFFFLLAHFSKEQFSTGILAYAIPAGVCIFLAIFILLESMKKNALSISLIILNLNFVIPVVLSVIFLKESAAPIQLAGMILSVIVIIIINIGNKSDTGGSRGSIILPIIACVANGLVNFFIKLNENTGAPAMWFFTVMYTTAAVTALLVGILLSILRQEGEFPIKSYHLGSGLKFLLLSGLCNGVCFYTGRMLAERMNAAAQFTIVTCASILLSLTIGFLFQGDKFTKKSAASIFFCVLAVLFQYSGIR